MTLAARAAPSLALGALIAAAPLPAQEPMKPDPACASPEARQFDFWIGEWNVRNRQRDPRQPADTTLYDTGGAVDRVHAMLDGCVIVEHWKGRLVPNRHVIGFSARAWDPERKRWVALLNWPGARGASFFLIEGEFAAGVASFVFEAATGGLVRYRFREITERGLTWEGARSESGEKWDPFWMMDFRRRDPITDAALLHEPASRISERCADSRARAFDFLIGEWEGEEVFEDSGSRRRVRVEAVPLLEGCAIMDVVTSGEGEELAKRWRVRSFVSEEGRWVQYSLEPPEPAFVRWEGGKSEAGQTFERVDPEGDPHVLTRARWSEVTSDSYLRETARSTDGGETWVVVARARMRRR